METTKKYNQIEELISIKKLDQYDFANFFNVINLGEKSYFNINKTIIFNNIDDTSESYYSTYIVKGGDTWTGISFKFYKTIKLWWLICKINNIKNPFTELTEGKYIKILNQSIVNEILNLIKK